MASIVATIILWIIENSILYSVFKFDSLFSVQKKDFSMLCPENRGTGLGKRFHDVLFLLIREINVEV